MTVHASLHVARHWCPRCAAARAELLLKLPARGALRQGTAAAALRPLPLGHRHGRCARAEWQLLGRLAAARVSRQHRGHQSRCR